MLFKLQTQNQNEDLDEELDLIEPIKIDFLSAAAHKFHGPKGVGFAFFSVNCRTAIWSFRFISLAAAPRRVAVVATSRAKPCSAGKLAMSLGRKVLAFSRPQSGLRARTVASWNCRFAHFRSSSQCGPARAHRRQAEIGHLWG